MLTFNQIKEKITREERLSEEDALYLYEYDDLAAIGELADQVNRKKNGNLVYYNINRHINPTNICALSCKFCAYSRKPGEPGSYEYSVDEILTKVQEAVNENATEIHMVGGLHPRWGLQHFLNILSSVKSRFPQIHIKGFTAVELDWLARRSRLTIKEVLIRLKEAGLDSLPGGGAEIFHQNIRDKITAKLSADEWIDIHRTAHNLEMFSNCTMLYGHVESYYHRVDHMRYLRELQDETKRFNAFIPLSFQPHNNDMGISKYTFGSDDLRTIAIARLYLDNFQHIKAYWIMLGKDIAQLALNYGANDLDGTVIEEKISNMAGSQAGMSMSRSQIEDLILRTGHDACERDTLYRPKGKTHQCPAPNAECVMPLDQLLKQVEKPLKNKKKLSIEEAETLAKCSALYQIQHLANKLTIEKCSKRKSYSSRIWLSSQCLESPEALLSEIQSKFEMLPAQGPKIINIDLARIKKQVSDRSVFDCMTISIITEMAGIIKREKADTKISLLGLKEIWATAQRTKISLEEAFSLLSHAKIDCIESSLFESESALTNNEVANIHRKAHQAGLKTVGKAEISMARDNQEILWQSFISRILTLNELAEETGMLSAISIEPSLHSYTSMAEYLKAVAMARVLANSNDNIIAPILSLPTISYKKISSVSSNPTNLKVSALPLLYGANDLGQLSVEDKNIALINAEMEPLGLELLSRNCNFEY
ncbi:MAG: aminofutalosine synthase MqnE [Bdellovibrionota bacterium]